MKLVVINGSPRNKKSNSKLLMDEFLKGFYTANKEAADIYFLASEKQRIEAVDAFRKNENILMIFPLYTDAMPGIVKEFFEKINAEAEAGKKRVGFIVQSGFPESKHSGYVEKYLEQFTIKRLNAFYLGTVIKGGVEGIQVMPPRMTARLYSSFYNLGEEYARTGHFSESIKEKLARPYSLSAGRLIFYRIMRLTGLTNFYWNSNLRKNKAFEKRFDKPYIVEELRS